MGVVTVVSFRLFGFRRVVETEVSVYAVLLIFLLLALYIGPLGTVSSLSYIHGSALPLGSA